MERTNRPSRGVVLLLGSLSAVVVGAAWPWANAVLDAVIR